MMRHRRRALLLVNMVALLPLMAVTAAMAYGLSARVWRVQAVERRRSNRDATLRHLVRRVQRDVRAAATATVERDATGTRLALKQGDAVVTYRVVGGRVTRGVGGAPAGAGVWVLERTTLDFVLEEIDGVPRLVWLRFVTRSWIRDRVPPADPLGVAATLGAGGV